MQICNFNINSVKSFSKINPCANGQISCTVVTHKNGGTGEGGEELKKEIWDYVIKNGIIITAVEYLPGAINKEANFQ